MEWIESRRQSLSRVYKTEAIRRRSIKKRVWLKKENSISWKIKRITSRCSTKET